MNYPIWEITGTGGGLLIAIIAVFHVYIAHFAVGGGLFIWLTDLKATRTHQPELLNYVRRHTWFFLLISMVLGGMTGVGIWFIIALVHPSATSVLIHNFVFGWAIEWVFFLGEVVALLVYHYQFERLAEKTRQLLAFFYFLFAFLSLFVINGIVGFMLTPGGWLKTGSFFAGFFNPSFWPSLVFRSFLSFMFAGIFAYITASWQKNNDFRLKLTRYASTWVIISLVLALPAGFWYWSILPGDVQVAGFVLNPESAGFVHTLIYSSVAVLILAVLLMIRLNRASQFVVALIVLVLGQLLMGGFEYSREIARKPYVIHDLMYSNSIMKSDVAKINDAGLLSRARWTAVRKVTDSNRAEAGREMFNLLCLSCHTVGGYNDIRQRLQDFTYTGIEAQLRGMGTVKPYMPPFTGTQKEMEALAFYLADEIMAIDPTPLPDRLEIVQQDCEVPPFDADNDEYVLLAWNDLGMHCVFDNDKWFSILPPANTLEAQLILRGETPEQITDGVSIHYQAEPGFEHPEEAIDFWEHSEVVYGAKLEPGIGLKGKGVQGELEFVEDTYAWTAHMIPAVPYRKLDGKDIYNPYPIYNLEARDTNGNVLATTKVVLPVSTEQGCRNCHGGDWRWHDQAGVSDETAINILKAHDRLNGTNLYAEALNGKPQLCQSCHADPVLGTEGKPELLNFSAAMHGWHANYMSGMAEQACVMCHPAQKRGNTICFRGFHSNVGLNCTSCHGTMEEHALALLKKEGQKASAPRLMKYLTTVSETAAEDVQPRTPWLQEPDCLTCHEDFDQPGGHPDGFNVWNGSPDELYRQRTGEMGIRCEACHGSPHALYPARNPVSPRRDNLQPLQYTGKPWPIGSDKGCAVCHTIEMEDEIHHENMLRPIRNPDKF